MYKLFKICGEVTNIMQNRVYCQVIQDLSLSYTEVINRFFFL